MQKWESDAPLRFLRALRIVSKCASSLLVELVGAPKSAHSDGGGLMHSSAFVRFVSSVVPTFSVHHIKITPEVTAVGFVEKLSTIL